MTDEGFIASYVSVVPLTKIRLEKDILHSDVLVLEMTPFSSGLKSVQDSYWSCVGINWDSMRYLACIHGEH